jgi:hypothetical protein
MQAVTDQWDKEQCDIETYCDMYLEWTKLFKHMGSALSIAFKDINEKSNIIRNNKAVQIDLKNAAEGSPESMYIHPFIMMEKALNVRPLNKDDNKKTLKKYNKDDILPWMLKYESTSRTLYRGAWFFDFLHIFTSDFASMRTEMMGKLAKKAYDTALAPYHPYLLKKAAGIAMNACKKREKFILSIQAE